MATLAAKQQHHGQRVASQCEWGLAAVTHSVHQVEPNAAGCVPVGYIRVLQLSSTLSSFGSRPLGGKPQSTFHQKDPLCCIICFFNDLAFVIWTKSFQFKFLWVLCRTSVRSFKLNDSYVFDDIFIIIITCVKCIKHWFNASSLIAWDIAPVPLRIGLLSVFLWSSLSRSQLWFVTPFKLSSSVEV